MGKGLPYSTARGNPATQEIIRETIKVKNLVVSVDGASGVGFGSSVAGGLPAGNILLLGAVAYMTFAGAVTAGLVDDWEGDFSIGTTATADATLGGTDIDIVGSSAIAAATLEVSPRTRGVSVTATNAAVLDNTDGSLELNLNLIVDDADISADDVLITANGEIHLLYCVMGDD